MHSFWLFRETKREGMAGWLVAMWTVSSYYSNLIWPVIKKRETDVRSYYERGRLILFLQLKCVLQLVSEDSLFLYRQSNSALCGSSWEHFFTWKKYLSSSAQFACTMKIYDVKKVRFVPTANRKHNISYSVSEPATEQFIAVLCNNISYFYWETLENSYNKPKCWWT